MRPLGVLSVPLSALLATLALSTLRLPLALAARTLQNVTVDDTDGSPTGGFQIVYEPPGVWSTGQNCTTCEAKVDRTQALNGTWHDVSFISDNPPPAPISATLTFDGVAVYAFCIITRSFSDPNGNWDLSFLIDGEPSGAFTLAPDGEAAFTYNYPVYANTSLAPGTHTFTMVVGHKGGKSSLALLDYMMFTQEVGSGSDPGSPSSSTGTSSTPAASSPIPSSSDSAAPAGAASSHSTSPTTTIALAVSLSVATLLALSALILLLARRRSHRLHAPHADPSNSALGDPHSKVDPSEGELGLGGDTLSSAGFRVLPIFPRHGRAHEHASRVAHPFVVPPARAEPLPPPAVSPSNATSYTWLPEAGAYVAVKGGDAGAGAGAARSVSSSSGSGSGTAFSGRERLDAALPPIPQSPQDARGASGAFGVSSHEPSATATATATAIERYAVPVGRSVQRYVQNDDGASVAGGGGGGGESAASPVSAVSTGMEDSKVRLEAAASERASPVSAVDPQIEPGIEPVQAVGGEFGVVEGTEVEAEAEDEGPPPYAPRAL